ncbi:hypothetical protein EJ02DRAFT_455406 [Clathrospora elynae]|uniref:DUF6590 domain-containing protein n=1 Tax=Clathrospora elynae TaxID=706981 RepID=A0A6A5SVY3_9PLEO|nr:hypothetical protein EJ02DRAFT_455406 [Clathrospora elynae]
MAQPQQEWNEYYQRYVYTHWNEQYQRSYLNHYVEGQGWVFLEWCTQTQTHQSQVQHQRNDSFSLFTSRATPAGQRMEGPPVRGSYNLVNPQPNSHYETLDNNFYVRGKDFFEDGKVFSVLFTEAAGQTVTSYNDAFSVVKFGEKVHTQVRRFIAVRQKREFCFAIPIFTYGSQGTKKSGVVANEHAIAYSYGHQPTLLPGESSMTKEPICIVMHGDERPLITSSRIYFGIHHPIQYNVKVKELGYVLPSHLVNLKGYWNMENLTDTNQDAAVTAEGSYESPSAQHGGAISQQDDDEESEEDDEEESEEDDEDENGGQDPYHNI